MSRDASTAPDPTGRAAQWRRARLQAEKDLAEARLLVHKSVRSFEKQLKGLPENQLQEFLKRGRRRFLRHLVVPEERALGWLLLYQITYLHLVRILRAEAHARGPGPLFFHRLVHRLPFLVVWVLVQVEERLFWGVTRAQREIARAVVLLPSTIQDGVEASRGELSTSEGRAGLGRALLDERHLTPGRRRALLFLGGFLLLVGWVLAEMLLRAFRPEYLPHKHRLDFLFFYGAITRILPIPYPFEFSLPQAARLLGDPTTIIVASIGTVVGSWVLFLVGLQVNRSLEVWMHKREWGRRFWAWFERNAPRYGYAMMGLILSIPFSPDAITAVFALFGLRMPWFLLTILVSSLIRYSIVLGVV